jgi:hypothetical protein
VKWIEAGSQRAVKLYYVALSLFILSWEIENAFTKPNYTGQMQSVKNYTELPHVFIQ